MKCLFLFIYMFTYEFKNNKWDINLLGVQISSVSFQKITLAVTNVS